MSNFPLRLEPELKAKLQELAKKEKRSLNKLIEVILDTHVNRKVMIVVNEPSVSKEKLFKGIK